MEKKIVIQGHDLRIGYRTGKQEKVVHEHLDFELRAGELTCLLGANGAGKSTLLRTLSASQPSLAGELKMLGTQGLLYGRRHGPYPEAVLTEIRLL